MKELKGERVRLKGVKEYVDEYDKVLINEKDQESLYYLTKFLNLDYGLFQADNEAKESEDAFKMTIKEKKEATTKLKKATNDLVKAKNSLNLKEKEQISAQSDLHKT
jgi:hypothetical protein